MRKEIIGNAELYLGDCLAIMPMLAAENKRAAVVATDPPYGINYVSSHRNDGPTEMLQNDDKAPLEAVPMIADLIIDGGALYLATRFDVSPMWTAAIAAAGLACKTPIFWDKGNHTAGDLEGDFGAQVEIFLFAHKGRHKLRGRRQSNLWKCPRDPAGAHPTPKPASLMGRMICASSDNGDLIIDPFMGSGSTGVACASLDRKFIGIELDEKYFDLAFERIQAAQHQQRLFA